ncbi:hypothetical protein PYV61_25920, partial [Roseisolibacter sp. H3M3-2]
MSGEPPRLPPDAGGPYATLEELRPGRPRLALSTRTAVEASQGALADRLRDLRTDEGDADPRRDFPGPSLRPAAGPARAASAGVGSTLLPTAPSPVARRDQLRLAAQQYVRTLLREGTAPAAALAAVRATVHQEAAAFLSDRRLAALERLVVRAARAACRRSPRRTP